MNEGIQGERGPTGDHGQTGERGRRGQRGTTSRSFSRGLATIFFGMLAIFMVLGFQVQQNQQDLQKANEQTCKARQTNVERTNALYEGLIQIESKNPFRFTSPQTINDRIRLFEAAKLIRPVCP